MKLPTHLNGLVQYTAFTAAAAEDIAGSFQIPFLASTATLTLSILKCVESVKYNKVEWIEILEFIHEILCLIINLYATSQPLGVLPTSLLYDIAKFAESLQKVFTVIKSQERMGKVKQFLKQLDISAQLVICKQQLSHALQTFKVQATGVAHSQMTQMKKDAKQQHEELVLLLNALTNSERSSVTGTLSTAPSVGSFSMLPPSPKIFHGRGSELQEVVKLLMQDSARIAILGAGGIGKTSLATAALHHPDIETKYRFRHFVPCHSTPTCAGLVMAIADHIGVEKGSNLLRKVVQYFTDVPPSLLVLDNLETPWEFPSARSEVEEVLSLLTDIPHLALVITLRGAERPGKVKWTHPFLAPLDPLSNTAALETFFDIADDTHEDTSVEQLLELTGNLPLAVCLMANVASYEGCENTLSRWRSESTHMLSDGYDQGSSLDTSIMLSFTSSRMTPGAQELLSILSMLPDGLTEVELAKAMLPIHDILACKATLLQTSLAFIDKDQKLKALVPIREYTLRTHPPTVELKLKLRKHFHQLLDFWNQFRDLNMADIAPQISCNLGNFNSIFLDALNTECPDVIQNMQSVLYLNQFYGRIQETFSPLLPELATQISNWKDHPIFGDYLVERFVNSDYLPVMDAEEQITQGHEYFKSKEALKQAKWYQALGIHFNFARLDPARALECYKQSLSLSDSTGHPSITGLWVLCRISNIMLTMGDPVGSHEHAKRAQEYAENIGDIYAQVRAINLQARYYVICANYQEALSLLQYGRDLLNSCGLEQCALDWNVREHEAEINILKTQYLESRDIQIYIASHLQPTKSRAILANLNIALIDIAIGVDSKIVHQNLETCRLHIKKLNGLVQAVAKLVLDQRHADLCLQDGDHSTANVMLAQTFVSSLNINLEQALICLERLADLSSCMNNVQNTLRWAGIFLGLAMKSKEKRATLLALRCLGQIFAAEGNEETALSLFSVAADGFNFMGVHRWQADCMVRMAEIREKKGDVRASIQLWQAARPLFERSSQVKDITRIDLKLAAVSESWTTST